MKKIAISFAIVFLTASICAASQGLTIVSKMTRNDGPPTTETGYIAEDHIRWGSGEGEVILDAKAGTMTTIDNNKKTYFVTTKQDVEAMAAKIKEQMNSPEMQRAQEAMKNLPPEQRKRMESMMGSALTMNVEKSGTSRTVAGYKCEEWTITVGQMSKTVECVTTDLKFPPQAWEMYRNLADSMKSIMSSMGPMAKNMSSMQEQMQKIKGFPLASKNTTSVMGHTSTSSTEVTEIRNGAIPASAWEIPAGYTKVDNPMTKAMERRR